MDKELNVRVKEILGHLVTPEYRDGVGGPRGFLAPSKSPLDWDAMSYLEDKGCVEGVDAPSQCRITARGRDYWEQLDRPIRYWFKRNWFPAVVAAVTILVGVVQTGVTIWKAFFSASGPLP